MFSTQLVTLKYPVIFSHRRSVTVSLRTCLLLDDLHSTYIIAGKSGLYLECIVVFELIYATDILSSNTKNSLKMLGDPSRGS